MDHWVKNPPTMQEIRFQGGEDRLEEGIATHSSVLAWEISQRRLVGYSAWGRKESVMTEMTEYAHI